MCSYLSMTKTMDTISETTTLPSSLKIPTISLAPSDNNTRSDISRAIANACVNPGFFQITSHPIKESLLHSFCLSMKQFFSLPKPIKENMRRSGRNSRGYFDDELTKRRIDWKECIDIGSVPRHVGDGSGSLLQDDLQACLDGKNQWPPSDVAPGFREDVNEYFDACAKLSDEIATLMIEGLASMVSDSSNVELGGSVEDGTTLSFSARTFLNRTKMKHSSYLRMNHYPPCQSDVMPPPLGISRHTDAGFLTVLLQDDDCHSLQVLIGSNIKEEGTWVTVEPTPGALTINTGDMAQVCRICMIYVLTTPHNDYPLHRSSREEFLEHLHIAL
uniref:Fe2OG dioxygenase domain-containing protein n=1 Tax=Corethron hystrix TaxID=216773 RepID=A0A7S1BY09_9STRA|mmetsp:Transcript_42994/g.100910  ORF Transcript_42994/g.100910 Transcript_42994/m.100910 type:complete len:331 (+) Transcript_42994:73-1065(+)